MMLEPCCTIPLDRTAGAYPSGSSDWAPIAGETASRVLVVDDLAGNRRVLGAMLASEGYTVSTAANGGEALAALAERPDLVLLDVMMPGLDGFEVCRQIKHDSDTRLIPVVLITALRCADDRIRGLDAGADDFISKPFNPIELRARVRSLIRIKGYTDDLDTAASVILSLGLTIEARDPTTNGHCQRLAALGRALGAKVGLDHDDLVAIERGGFLHDLGKIGVPDAVLLKPGPLTKDEFEQVKRHTLIGERLCADLRSLTRVRPIIRSHHERLDGSGYPDGLRGDAVPLLAQIASIVDIFDALTNARPYKPALSVEHACGVLADEAARGWRRTDLVDAFIELVA
jgi:putative two-component system response regulator